MATRTKKAVGGRRVRTTWAVMAGVTALGLALAACSGGGQSPGPEVSPAQTTSVPSSPIAGRTEPLTGRPVKAVEEAQSLADKLAHGGDFLAEAGQ